MGERNLTLRAVLCDIYKTLLEVGPPPADADQRWLALCGKVLAQSPSPALAEFGASADAIIRREHETAKAIGISHPEISWPSVVRGAWPALATLDARSLDDFLFEHAQLQRTVRLMPGAADTLNFMSRNKLVLGIVSNSQSYTFRELDAALSAAGLSRALFAPDLCFMSFENGFSKPDPHVFRLLTARLGKRDIAPGETLVVGDREDNDILPARAAGFRTWLLSPATPGPDGGNWQALEEQLRGS